MFRVGGGGCGSAGAECGLRTVGPLGAGGSGGRVGPGRTGEGSPRLEVMGGLGVSRPGLCAPGPAAPRPSRVRDAGPAAGAAGEAESRCGGRRRRRRAGTRPAPRPDAQFGSCLRREGGRSAKPVGKCSLRGTGSREGGGVARGRALGIVGVVVPGSAAEAHKVRLEDSKPHRAPRRRGGGVSGTGDRWGLCGGSRRLGGGGGAARAVAPLSPRGRVGAGLAALVGERGGPRLLLLLWD